MSNNSKRIQSTRWTFCIYPGAPPGGSAPDDYSDVIRRFHVSFAYSPIHDPDPDNKKEHIHVYLEFPHNMGLETIRTVFMEPLGVGNLYPEQVWDPPQLCKYLSHLEDKWVDENGNRKHLYDPRDVVFEGIPYWEYIMTEKGFSTVSEEIMRFLEANPDIRTYRKLYLYAADNGIITWQSYIDHNVYKVNSMLKR